MTSRVENSSQYSISTSWLNLNTRYQHSDLTQILDFKILTWIKSWRVENSTRSRWFNLTRSVYKYVEYGIQAYLNKHDCKNLTFWHKWTCIQVIHCKRFYESFIKWIYYICFYHDQCCWRINHWISSDSNK